MHVIRRLMSFRISNPILAGLYSSFCWMIFGAFILSLLLWLTSMQENELSIYTYVVHGCSVGIGGFIAGKRAGSKGWYQGGLTGALYGILIMMIGFLALDSSFDLTMMIGLASVFLIGAIGGIMGVNTRNNS